MTHTQNCTLLLEDGTILQGSSFGKEVFSEGEIVFNTGMVGYPETLTDPSYTGQLLVLTYPLIGNYGIPDKTLENGLLKYFESNMISIKCLIVSDYSTHYSHYQAIKSLADWLIEQGVPAMQNVDTRALTQKLRSKGTMLGKFIPSTNPEIIKEHLSTPFSNPNLNNLASTVNITSPVLHKKGDKTVVLVDCGVKNNIIQAFLRRDRSVLQVPHDFNFNEIECNGVVISNGPGDPKQCVETIKNVKTALQKNTPLLGICLGSQILGLASGADTYKLKYGHRSHNQPVNEIGSKRCYITSQNHGYAIDSSTITQDWREWFVNDNDGTNEGIIHIFKPFFGTQFHPEASPGPDDTEFIFDMFVRSLI